MALRLAGVSVPTEKRVEIALTYVYGIGIPTSQKILHDLKISPDTRVKDLSEKEQDALRDYIRKYKVEGDLRREILGNIKRLKEIKSWRGLRHEKHLPVRGQRTKTNSRTVRGNKRVTLGSGRKDASQKT